MSSEDEDIASLRRAYKGDDRAIIRAGKASAAQSDEAADQSDDPARARAHRAYAKGSERLTDRLRRGGS